MMKIDQPFINLCRTALAMVFIVQLSSCLQSNKKKIDVSTSKNSTQQNLDSVLNFSDFDTIIDGKRVSLYWLKNKDIRVAITNYGGRIVGLWVPDKNNKMADVVVGFNSVKGFINSTEPYFGALIGRVGNRIAKGQFSIEGVEYNIPTNNGENSLHGGIKGFQDVVWTINQQDEQSLELSYESPDMEEGFPGNLKAKVIYSVTSNNALRIEYIATTDKTTPVNLTSHAFFNLNGEGNGTILNHIVKIDAHQYTPVDEGLIPTGKLLSVENTPFDFTKPYTIGERINEDNEQLNFGKGYDHNFVVDSLAKKTYKKVATVIGDVSGIVMEVYTEEPGLQFYSGNFMNGQNTFKSGAKDDFRTAFALETQHFPDAPNQSDFPSILLEPGEIYQTVTEYRFSVNNSD